MTRISYVIATYAGTDTHYSLELHLQSLYMHFLKNPESVDRHVQIVVVVPPVVTATKYYDHEFWTDAFATQQIQYSVVDYVGENKHASYDQWLQGYQAYPTSDHYMFVEDDYVLNVNSTDIFGQWIALYGSVGTDHYLCSYAAQTEHKYHAVISNGIVSGQTMKTLVSRCQDANRTLLQHYYDCSAHCNVPQIGFSDMFLTMDIPVISMHEQFAAVFWSSYRNRLELYSPSSDLPYLLVPMQYLVCKQDKDVTDVSHNEQRIVVSNRTAD